jgi:hypothetical protein
MTQRRRPPTKRCRASRASRATRFCQSAALSRRADSVRKARGILGLVPMTAGRTDSTSGTAGTAGTAPFMEIRAAQCRQPLNARLAPPVHVETRVRSPALPGAAGRVTTTERQITRSSWRCRTGDYDRAYIPARSICEIALRKDHEGGTPLVARSYFIRVSKSVPT